MYYSKKNAEVIPDQETAVWTCSSKDCSCWMREDLSFEEVPTCPLCHSSMEKGTKMLPPLSNTTNR